MKVLLAEDEAVNRRIAAMLLERVGHRVLAVRDGAEAVAAVAEAAFDLVLLDVQMEAMDGPSAARAIRGLVNGALVPIIALTASPWPEEVAACRAAGMNGCLAKPLDIARLSASLAEIAAGAAWVGAEGTAAGTPLVDEAFLANLAQDLTPDLFRASLKACDASLVQSLAALAGAPDRASIAAWLHKLRGTAATYGLKALQVRAGEVEAVAKGADGDLGAALDALRRLADDSRRAFADYRRALG